MSEKYNKEELLHAKALIDGRLTYRIEGSAIIRNIDGELAKHNPDNRAIILNSIEAFPKSTKNETDICTKSTYHVIEYFDGGNVNAPIEENNPEETNREQVDPDSTIVNEPVDIPVNTPVEVPTDSTGTGRTDEGTGDEGTGDEETKADESTLVEEKEATLIDSKVIEIKEGNTLKNARTKFQKVLGLSSYNEAKTILSDLPYSVKLTQEQIDELSAIFTIE